MQLAGGQIHSSETVSTIDHRDPMRREQRCQRFAKTGERGLADRDRMHRPGDESLGHVKSGEIGERGWLRGTCGIDINDGVASCEHVETSEVLAEHGAPNGVLRDRAVGEGEFGGDVEELVVAVDLDAPADGEVLRVDGDDLDLVHEVLVVLLVRGREGPRCTLECGICRAAGTGSSGAPQTP